MQIIIKSIFGLSTYLDVQPSDTIGCVKEKYGELRGIQYWHFNLAFGGKILEDNKTLADYNIQDQSTLYIILKNYDFYVNYGEGKKLTIYASHNFCFCCHKISWLKEEIKNYLGIELKNQQLSLDGQILEDNESLSTYGITKGTEIKLDII